jgi:hypothetical protein
MTAPAPSDELAPGLDVALAPDTFGETEFAEDPLTGIPGADELPADQQKQIRDAVLRKMNQATDAERRMTEREAQYMEAIERMAGKQDVPATEPEAPNYEGMTPQQIVEDIAQRVSERIVDERLQKSGVADTKVKTDAMLRQLQLLEAARHYPNVSQYQKQLVELNSVLESRLGKEKAMEFSVVDMMDLLTARNARLKRGAQPRRQAAPAAAKPTASIAHGGVRPAAVQPVEEPSSLAEAFKLAQEQHGQYNPSG